jgi:hypothetical protein
MTYSFDDFLADVDAELSTLIDKTSADFPEYNFESDFESKFPVSLSAQEAILSAVPTPLKPMIDNSADTFSAFFFNHQQR